MAAVTLDLEYDKDTLLCGATCWTNGFLTVPQLWVSQTASLFVPLTNAVVIALVETLWNFHESGVAIVTWGGTGSDWPKLLKAVQNVDGSEEMQARIKTMALDSIDIPLISAAANGMMMGLTAATLGMGFGKRTSCDSEQVPVLWNTGELMKQNEVVQHVQWDAWATAQIWTRLMMQVSFARPRLCWITQRSGARDVRLKRERSANGDWTLPTVRSVLEWEAPETKFQIPSHLDPASLTQWLRS